MLKITELPIPGYESVIEFQDPDVKLHGFIAVHSTKLGPSLGGLRMVPYASREEALQDALRLSKAMSYKSALAGTGLGGGKSVLIGNPRTDKSTALLQSFGDALNYLKGRYIAAEDVGTTTEDMTHIRTHSEFVGALPTQESSGDPSRFTAYGIYCGMRAVALHLYGSPSLKNRHIAVQGIGSVGEKLAQFLFWEGAKLTFGDINEQHASLMAHLMGANVVPSSEILYTPCDILAPCALGGSLNPESIPQLRCQAIAGSANNQLKSEADGLALKNRGILYAPDFVVNAGGIINAACEYRKEGYDATISRDKTAKIFETLLEIFNLADQENLPTNVIANRMAESKLTPTP